MTAAERIRLAREAPVRYAHGVAYFQDFGDATALVARLGGDSRVVVYQLGYAVQYRRSGPYFPEMDEAPCDASAAAVRSSVERGDALAIFRTSTELEEL